MAELISVPVDPQQDVRTRRFLQQVAEAINALIRADLLRYVGPGEWTIEMPAGSFVSSFNTRTGAVTLTSGDVTGALGYTPVQSVSGTAPIVSSGGANPAISISTFVGSGASHARGAVPDPGASAGTVKFLREDASWQVPPGTLSIGDPITGGRADGSVLYEDASGQLAVTTVVDGGVSGFYFSDAISVPGLGGTPLTLSLGATGGGSAGAIRLRGDSGEGYVSHDDSGGINIVAGDLATPGGNVSVYAATLYCSGNFLGGAGDKDTGFSWTLHNTVQTVDAWSIVQNSAILSRFNKAGYFMTRKVAAPADGDLATSEVSWWWSDTATSPAVKFKGKDSAGTVFSFAVPITLFTHFANAGNGTTVETDLYSDTIPANRLAANGERLEVEYGGVFVSSATATRQIKIYFGGTAFFDTGALTLSLSSAWTAYVTLIRVSSTVVRYMVSLTTEGAALAAYTAVGEITGLTLSNTNVLKITGQAAGVGAASDDIVARLGSVIWLP